jgi:hypothetical protein
MPVATGGRLGPAVSPSCVTSGDPCSPTPLSSLLSGGERMTFVLGRADGSLVDLDALWAAVQEIANTAPPERVDDGTAVAIGTLLGIRLTLTEPTIARAFLASFEPRSAGGACGGTAEPVEVVCSLVAVVLDKAAV